MAVVQKFNTVFLLLLGLMAIPARAEVHAFRCTGVAKTKAGKDLSVTIAGMAGGALSTKVAMEVEPGTTTTSEYTGTWHAEADPGEPGAYRLTGAGGAPLGVLKVNGSDEGAGILTYSTTAYACRLSSASAAESERAYRVAVAEWNRFKAKQPKACSVAADSGETLQDGRPAVTVVLLQGYAISPVHMQSIQRVFAGLGMNVLVPRLRGHFNVNPRDLDEVKAEQWIQQSEEVLKIAGKMSPRVIVAGYSLGGLLASRLALLHPEKISAVLLFSPAWRVTGMIKAGSAIGSVFGLSANDLFGSGVRSCATYISAKGGLEVERLISLTEGAAGGSEYGGAEGSAFRRFKTPSLVANILDDDTVDGAFASEVRGRRNSTRTATVAFTKGNHMNWIYRLGAMNPDYAPFKGDMTAQIEKFLKANKLAR